MEKLLWQNILKYNLAVLRILGLWPKGDKFYSFDVYTVYAIFVLMFLHTTFTLSQVMNIFVVYSDLQNLSENIFIMVTVVLTLVKMYYFIRNRGALKQLMSALKNDMFQPTKQQIDIVKPDITFWKNVSLILVATVSSCLTFWCTFPLLDTSKQRRLPFSCWYPFNTQSSPQYELTYIHQVFSIWALASTNLNLDTLISALMMLIGAQCDIISDNLKQLKRKKFFEEFAILVQHHKEILRLAESCNQFFNMIAFGQFFTSVACIAMTLFRMTVVPPLSSEFYSLSFYLGAAIQEIFLYCWFGNEVGIKSSRFVYAVFESEWAEAPLRVQNNLLIFILRCQRPIKMSAFKLVYLTLDTYVSVLRVAWSYFAVLQNINSSE